MHVLSRWALPLLALSLALAACGGSTKHSARLQTSYRAPEPYSLRMLAKQSYDCGRNEEPCVSSYLTRITGQYGPRAALAMLDSLERRGLVDPALDTHQLAHEIGETTAKRFGANRRAFDLCSSSFNYGCVHGFFIYVLGRTKNPSEAARVICNSSKAGPLVPTFNCWHGVGHGVMMARGNDLQPSLGVCDSLGSASAADGCWQGVFMENVNAGMRHEARPGVFSPSDPLRPCTRVRPTYRQECFINHAGWLANLAHDDIAKMSRYCLDAPERYEPVCAQSIGLMVTNPSWQVSFLPGSRGKSFAEISWALCTRFPAQLRRDCVIGGVDNLANFDQLDVVRSNAFCGLAASALQKTCYTEIGVNLARRTTDQTLARARCGQVSGGHERECLVGVRQGRLPVAPVVVPDANAQQEPRPAAGKPSATVHMTDTGFSPFVVEIRKGQTVRFVNDSGRGYWPASNPHPIHTGYPGFDAQNAVHSGGSWAFAFDRAGRWGYHNHLSPETKGEIVVTS